MSGEQTGQAHTEWHWQYPLNHAPEPFDQTDNGPQADRKHCLTRGKVE